MEARKDWVEAQVGKDLSEYGFSGNRAWIKLAFNCTAVGKKRLIFPSLEDQFGVFHKGQYLGLYGRLGKGLDLELPVKAGANELLLLVDSWGRYGDGSKLGEKKGLLLPIFDGGEVQAFGEGWHFLEAAGALDFQIFSAPTFSGRGWELGALAKTLERPGYVCARKKFKVPDWATRVRLNLHAGDVRIQVAVNGDLVGEHPDARGAQYQEFELSTPHLKKKKDDPSLGHFDRKNENTMALFFKGPTRGYQHCELLFLGPELNVEAGPSARAWPRRTRSRSSRTRAGASRPRRASYGFWKTSFKTPPLKEVAAVGAGAWPSTERGVLWLNGNCLGKHWKNGVAEQVKLPLSWLKPVNELLVLEEEAGLSQEAAVTFLPRLSEEKLP